MIPLEGYEDCIRSRTVTQFSFGERLKILFGWQPTVTTNIHCEKAPGKLQSEDKTILLLPEWWVRLFRRRELGGEAEIDGEQAK